MDVTIKCNDKCRERSDDDDLSNYLDDLVYIGTSEDVPLLLPGFPADEAGGPPIVYVEELDL